MPSPAFRTGRVAFYAPMKPPGHPVPSGDRTMARLWLRALGEAGVQPFLASTFCSRDGTGDRERQSALIAAAETEAARLAAEFAAGRPAAWFTYHNYYKAPDLLGPRVSRRLAIPYVLAEASSAPRRAVGPYALFAEAADAATRLADAHLVLNARDVDGLEAAGARGLVRCPPFLSAEEWPVRARWQPGRPVRLAAAAMMRPGDKLASYRALAAALARVPEGWELAIAGDGPERASVEALFRPFGGRVTFRGQLAQEELAALFRTADLLVWPGVNEAFGMVYLEAAACGCPALATSAGGVAEVVAHGTSGFLVAPGEEAHYAQALRGLIADPARLVELGRGAAARVRARHGLEAAAARLREIFAAFAAVDPGDAACA